MERILTIFVDEETLSPQEIQKDLDYLNAKEKARREKKKKTSANSITEAVEKHLDDNPDGLLIKL